MTSGLKSIAICHNIWHETTDGPIREDRFSQATAQAIGSDYGCGVEAVEHPGGVLLRPVRQRPSMVQVDGLWIHQGTAEPGANWDRVLDDVGDERAQSLLKP